MSSRYRHRRTPLASTPFPSPVEPGEIVVNTANRQIAVGDASAGTLGQPKQLIAVRYFDVTASYVLNDLVVQTGKVYRANGNIPPGAFNATNWTDLGGSATAALVTFAPGGNVSSTNVQAAIAELDSEKAAVTYVDAADANLAASTQAGFDLQTTAIAAKVAKAGDTMSGPLTLPGDPTANLHAATKQYADSLSAAGGAALATKVNLAGDTMTGALTIRGTNPTLIQDAPTTAGINIILGRKNGLTRWDLRIGDDDIESGGNAGSDFSLYRYDDAGNYIGPGPVLQINRATAGLSGSSVATAAEYIANSAPGKMLTPGAAWGAAAMVALTDAASVAPDFSTGIDFYWALGAAGRTLANPTNAKGGQKGIIYLRQDATGSRTITGWGNQYWFPGGVKPVLSTAPNALDIISYSVNSAMGVVVCNFSAGFA